MANPAIQYLDHHSEDEANEIVVEIFDSSKKVEDLQDLFAEALQTGMSDIELGSRVKFFLEIVRDGIRESKREPEGLDGVA